ncbi:hypothetical protein EAY82_22590, partial [Vibrio anguillarum]|nr:hypothetical protein [Vibrio anguillarum]
IMLRVCLWPERGKEWAIDLLIVAACCVHARKENRFASEARTHNSYNAHFSHQMAYLPFQYVKK